MVTSKMPHLRKPEAVVLSMWSFGIAITQCCGLSTVSGFLATLFEQPENTVRQRLREWYKNRTHKSGQQRCELDVSASFVPLLRWILSWWPPDEKRLVLAADASTLSDRFTVLLIAVVYRGCSLPVVWKIVGATAKGSWQPYWLALFKHFETAIEPDWFVIVTTDRGLYAKWFYEGIQALHWHPFMRINQQGYYQVNPQQSFAPLKDVITQLGQSWTGKVTCFKTNPLRCTLLARWDEGYSDPWLIVTDLEPEQAEIVWYGLRSWIECLFKDIKRGGLNWHLTRMREPERVERLWLAIAVAMIWLVSVGGQADAQLAVSSLERLEASQNKLERDSHPDGEQAHESVVIPSSLASDNNADVDSKPTQFSRHLSCFRRGFLVVLAAVFKGDPLPIGEFLPDFSVGPEPVPIFASG